MSHHTAPIAVRERIAVAPERIPGTLKAIKALDGIHETALITTCNRTEFYLLSETRRAPSFESWLQQQFQISREILAAHSYTKNQRDAVRHLMQVTAGLDSMVLGEPQIMGQVKQAYLQAQEAEALGAVLERLFQKSFAAGKAIRSHTSVGKRPVSVASTTIMLAKQIFGQLAARNVMLIGAGEMIELCLRHLRQQGIDQLTLVNRSLDKAERLAEAHSGAALGLDKIESALHQADIIISSTASTEPVLSKKQLKSALKQRRHQPMFIVDIAVPRDIDPAAGELRDIYLYTIDDLQAVIRQNRDQRRQALDEAGFYVDSHAQEFINWWRASRANSQIARLRQRAHEDSEVLISKALQQIDAGVPPREAMQQLTQQLTNKLLHRPSTRLREAAEAQRYDIVETADRLFSDGDEAEDKQK